MAEVRRQRTQWFLFVLIVLAAVEARSTDDEAEQTLQKLDEELKTTTDERRVAAIKESIAAVTRAKILTGGHERKDRQDIASILVELERRHYARISPEDRERISSRELQLRELLKSSIQKLKKEIRDIDTELSRASNTPLQKEAMQKLREEVIEELQFLKSD